MRRSTGGNGTAWYTIRPTSLPGVPAPASNTGTAVPESSQESSGKIVHYRVMHVSSGARFVSLFVRGPLPGPTNWGWPDFCHMLAQLFFCSFAQHHCNFRKTLAKVPDAVGTVQPAGRGSQITIFYCTFLYIQYFTLCTLYFDFTQNCQSVLSAICIVAVRLY